MYINELYRFWNPFGAVLKKSPKMHCIVGFFAEVMFFSGSLTFSNLVNLAIERVVDRLPLMTHGLKLSLEA